MSRNLLKAVSKTGIQTGNHIGSMARVFAAICVLAFVSFATPRLGAFDVPELPMGDGTGDTPDMFIKMVPNPLAPAVSGDGTTRLSSLRGRVVLLDVFWSQCPHCEEHAPHVVELYNQYRQRGFTILGLASDQPNRIDDVKKYLAKAKVNYPVGFVSTEIVAYYLESTSVPQMVLFGTDGKMVKRIVGWEKQTGQELKQAIEAQLEKLPTVKPGSKASSKSSPRKLKQA